MLKVGASSNKLIFGLILKVGYYIRKNVLQLFVSVISICSKLFNLMKKNQKTKNVHA